MNHSPERRMTLIPPENSLFFLSEQEEQDLSARLARWSGICRMFVHPLYLQYESNADWPIPHDTQKSIDFCKTIVALPEEKTPPIILMEEILRVQSTLKLLTPAQKLFLATTERSSPRPITNRDGSFSAQGFDDLANLLKRLGVSSVLLGGMVLTTNEWDFGVPIGGYSSQRRIRGAQRVLMPSGCVGQTARELAERDIQVQFSHGCYPENFSSILAKELKNIHRKRR